MKANCRSCGVLITNVENVGEDRHVWPGPRTDYLCMDCHLAKASGWLKGRAVPSDFKKSGPRKRDADLLRRFRLEHAGEPCDECELRPGIHLHHRKFRSQLGDDVESNLSWLCGSCHDAAHGIRSIW